MHSEARAFVEKAVRELGPFGSVVEYGALNINGGVRDLFTGDYLGIDPQEGPGVDVVADAATWKAKKKADCVVCCEVFEHTPDWPELVASAARALKPKGALILTMAGPGRAPHSAVDGGAIRDGEHYENVEPSDLIDVLREQFTDIHVDQLGPDVRATARRKGHA